MGKVQKKATKIASKYANTGFGEEPKTAKERVEQELHLLHVRKQAITSTKKTPSVHKVKKVGTTKRAVSTKKQKKLARALAVADKEEKKIEATQVKAEKRKMGKTLWE